MSWKVEESILDMARTRRLFVDKNCAAVSPRIESSEWISRSLQGIFRQINSLLVTFFEFSHFLPSCSATWHCPANSTCDHENHDWGRGVDERHEFETNTSPSKLSKPVQSKARVDKQPAISYIPSPPPLSLLHLYSQLSNFTTTPHPISSLNHSIYQHLFKPLASIFNHFPSTIHAHQRNNTKDVNSPNSTPTNLTRPNLRLPHMIPRLRRVPNMPLSRKDTHMVNTARISTCWIATPEE